ncbi:MAG TPA: hypothetical protein ENI92_01120, partial [Bacteroidetes bacterium]|nr:hypothetical protein [Bacteroidota bacterium]
MSGEPPAPGGPPDSPDRERPRPRQEGEGKGPPRPLTPRPGSRESRRGGPGAPGSGGGNAHPSGSGEPLDPAAARRERVARARRERQAEWRLAQRQQQRKIVDEPPAGEPLLGWPAKLRPLPERERSAVQRALADAAGIPETLDEGEATVRLLAIRERLKRDLL